MDTPQGGSDPVESNPSSSSVFIVSNFWKELDLEKEKSLLDGQGLRIAENLENSQKNRRKLARVQEISRKLQQRKSYAYLIHCLRVTKKKLIILQREQNLVRILS